MVESQEVPYLTTEQMTEVDRAMIEDYSIELVQMMENAGGHLAQLARRLFLGGNAIGKQVVVLAGSGGNGGGVMVFLTKAVENLVGVPKQQVEILRPR